MRINNNIAALNTLRQYSSNTSSTNKAMEKLSSGLAINRAGDDAAGLAISEKMRAQIRGIDTATDNSQNAISLVQTAEGALTETHSILQRMNELAVQSSSDTNENIDRNALNAEYQQLITEINDIASQTKFNNKYLLDGTYSGAKINADSTVFSQTTGLRATDITVNGNAVAGTYSDLDYTAGTVDTTDLEAADGDGWADDGSNFTISNTAKSGTYTLTYVAASTSWTASLDGVALDLTQEGDTLSFGGIQVDIGDVDTGVADYATGVDFEITAATYTAVHTAADGTATNLTGTLASDGSLTYTDANNTSYGIKLSSDAVALGSLTGELVVDSTGGALTIQTGAASGETLDITIGAMDVSTLGLSNTSITDKTAAQSAVDAVSAAINTVSTQRANLGAYQNRLEHKINNLSTSSENLQAAESRVRDVDMAEEMVNFTKTNILLQAAQSMLAQANSQPQGVLQLLQ